MRRANAGSDGPTASSQRVSAVPRPPRARAMVGRCEAAEEEEEDEEAEEEEEDEADEEDEAAGSV